MKALEPLGVVDSIMARGFILRKMTILNSKESVLGQFPWVPPDKVQFPFASKYFEKELEPLKKSNEIVYLLFADGLGSKVRRKEQLGKKVDNIPFPNSAAEQEGSVTFMSADPSGDDASFIVGIGGLLHQSRQEWAAFRKDKQGFYDQIQKFAGPNWSRMIRTTVKDVDPDSLTTWLLFILTRPLRSTSSSGRTILIGDAAHAMSPAGAQGGAMAFEDAQTLAYVLSRHDEKALKVWEAQRMKRVDQIVEYTSAIEWVGECVIRLLLLWYGEDGRGTWIFTEDVEAAIKSVC